MLVGCLLSPTFAAGLRQVGWAAVVGAVSSGFVLNPKLIRIKGLTPQPTTTTTTTRSTHNTNSRHYHFWCCCQRSLHRPKMLENIGLPYFLIFGLHREQLSYDAVKSDYFSLKSRVQSRYRCQSMWRAPSRRSTEHVFPLATTEYDSVVILSG